MQGSHTGKDGCTLFDIVWHRPLPDGCKPSSVTVTKDEAERYFVSILVEEDIKPLEITPKMVGLDLGLKSMVITSDGHTHGNPKFFHKDEKKLAKAQTTSCQEEKRLEEPCQSSSARWLASIRRIADRRQRLSAQTFDSHHTREPSRMHRKSASQEHDQKPLLGESHQ